MKSITLLLISTIVISNVLSCGDNGKSFILKFLNDIESSLPVLIESAKNLKECQTHVLKPICGKDYSYFTSIKNQILFKSVKKNVENLDTFFEIILSGLPIIEEDKSKIMEILYPMSYTGFSSPMVLEVLYDRESIQKNKGVYFTLFGDRNCNDKKTVDFLYVGIKSQFILNKDVFNYEEFRINDDKRYCGNMDFSHDQCKDFLSFLQLGAFSDVEDMIKMYEKEI